MRNSAPLDPTSEQIVTMLEEMLRGSDEKLFPVQLIQSPTSFFQFWNVEKGRLLIILLYNNS